MKELVIIFNLEKLPIVECEYQGYYISLKIILFVYNIHVNIVLLYVNLTACMSDKLIAEIYLKITFENILL